MLLHDSHLLSAPEAVQLPGLYVCTMAPNPVTGRLRTLLSILDYDYAHETEDQTASPSHIVTLNRSRPKKAYCSSS